MSKSQLNEFNWKSLGKLGSLSGSTKLTAVGLIGAYLASRNLDKKKALIFIDSEAGRKYFEDNPFIGVKEKTIAEFRKQFKMPRKLAMLVVKEYKRLTGNGRRKLPKNIKM